MDSNHDKQIQRLLCYRYTIRQLWNKGREFSPGVKGLTESLCPRNIASS
jgi:hypothetical protein